MSTGETRMEPESRTITIVEVPPGTYRFTHHTGETDFDHWADDVVFADVRRIS